MTQNLFIFYSALREKRVNCDIVTISVLFFVPKIIYTSCSRHSFIHVYASFAIFIVILHCEHVSVSLKKEQKTKINHAIMLS